MKPKRRAPVSVRQNSNQTIRVMEVISDMRQPTPALNIEECLLCLESTTSQNNDSSPSWDSAWSESCAESLCKMLDLSVDMFRVFFLGSYCPVCKQMIRDVDYFIRTVDTLERQLSCYRVKVSTLLHNNFDTWINKRNAPIPTSDPHLPSTSSSNPGSCESQPVMDQPVPAPSGVESDSDFLLDEIKRDIEDDVYSQPSPLDSHNETDHIFYSDLDFAPLAGGLTLDEEDQEVTVGKRVKVKAETTFGSSIRENSYSDDGAQHGESLGRVTRASNRLRKEITYREDSGSEDLQSPDKEAKTREAELKKKKTGQRNSQRRVYPRAITTSSSIDGLSPPSSEVPSTSTSLVILKPKPPSGSRKKRKLESKSQRDPDPTFEILSDMEESQGDDSDDQTEVRQSRNVKVTPVKTRRKRSSAPSKVTLASKEKEDSLRATRRFLHALDREEMEKICSYICTSEGCGRRFMLYSGLKWHKVNKHSEAFFPCSFQCPFCPNVWFLNDYQLDAHIIRVHQGENQCFICPVMDCPVKYAKNLRLVGHLRREHPYHPVEESRTTKFSFGLEYRDKLVPGHARGKKPTVRMLRCPMPGCPTRCLTQILLDMHQSQVHDKDPFPFKCREAGCSKAFKHYEGYKRHMKLVHDTIGEKDKDNVATCPFCGYRCVGRSKLNMHMRRKHAKLDVPKFSCNVCGHLYFVLGDFEEHEKLHTQETGFNCVIYQCQSKEFSSQEALRVHTFQTHVRGQRKVCDICGSVHGSNWLLAQHKQTHAAVGEEPLKCRYCDKRFKHGVNRISHEQIMHGDRMEKKTYKCSQCDETFTVRQYLYKHNAWHKYGSNANLPVAKKKLIQDESSFSKL